MTQPTVSVIIPTYNRAHLLSRAIDSVIAQTHTDWELILVDDGSTDSTPSLAKGYVRRLGDRFVYLPRPHVGCCAARNAGIDAARGGFIAFLDSDDEYRPGKLRRQLELFTLRPELGLVYCDYDCVAEDGSPAGRAFDTRCRVAHMVPRRLVAPGLYTCQPTIFDVLLRGYFIATITGLVRREVLADQIRFMKDPAYSEEWLFYLQVTRACRSGVVDEPLCVHHFTPGSISRTNSTTNLVKRRGLLRQMPSILAPINRAQRRVMRHHLATTCRQLGFNAHRTGRHHEAALFFGESFYSCLVLVDLWRAIESAVRALFTANSRLGDPNAATPEAAESVR